jgi:histidinol-phosphate aminotransferase
MVEALAARGVFVRMPFAAPQNRCIRVTAGKPEDLDALAAAMPDALHAAADR